MSIEAHLSHHEKRLAELCEQGRTVVANLHKDAGHANLIAWATRSGLYVYIGRPSRGRPGSRWRNPYEEGRDGDRAEVVEKHRLYLPSRPDLLERVHDLRGRVLGCWCAPLPCHGDVLAELANAGQDDD